MGMSFIFSIVSHKTGCSMISPSITDINGLDSENSHVENTYTRINWEADIHYTNNSYEEKINNELNINVFVSWHNRL